jgi:hypothetical protein
MQIVVGANRLPKYWINFLLLSTALKFGRQWQAAVECNVKNMYFVQTNVENVEIFVENNNFHSLMTILE